MLDREDERICQRVLRQYEEGKEYLTKTLPPEMSSRWLRYLRERACRSSAQQECLKWTVAACAQHAPQSCSCKLRFQAKTPDYVCNTCTHPVVTIERLVPPSSGAWDRTLRRYLSGEVGMLPDALGRVVFHAFEEKWIDDLDLLRIATEIKKFELAIAALNTIEKRIRKQKKSHISQEDLEKEFVRQGEIMDRKSDEIFEKVRTGNDVYAKEFLKKAENYLKPSTDFSEE